MKATNNQLFAVHQQLYDIGQLLLAAQAAGLVVRTGGYGDVIEMLRNNVVLFTGKTVAECKTWVDTTPTPSARLTVV